MSKKGLFIAFEGPEGSGKTTQAERLVATLKQKGLPAVQVREPGGTRIGETIRAILLDVENKGMHPLTEFFLFLASRVKFVHDIVLPRIQEGQIVVADRFALSTMAYQIHARGLPKDPCLISIDLAVQGSHPDVYFLLMVKPELGRSRQVKQGKNPDRFESEALDFHQRVHEGYNLYREHVPHHHMIHTDNLDEDQVHKKVLAYLTDVYPNILNYK